MVKEYGKSLVIGSTFSICLCYYAYKPTLWVLFAVGFLFLSLLVQLFASSVLCFIRYRDIAPFWYIPPLICLAFILTSPLAVRIGVKLSDWTFKREMANFSLIVDELKSGQIVCGSNTMEIVPKRYPKRISSIMASKDGGGAFTIVFAANTGTSFQRFGYLYTDCDQNLDCSEKFKLITEKWNLRAIGPHWYQFSNKDYTSN